MRIPGSLTAIILAACAATPKAKAVSVSTGPALMPHEAPGDRRIDVTLRASSEIRCDGHDCDDQDAGGGLEVAGDVGVGRDISLGVANTVRVALGGDHEAGFDDLRVRAGWSHATAVGLHLRLLVEAWLPTHADVLDEAHPPPGARASLTLARVVDGGWIWIVPAAQASRDEPRLFEGGLELGAGFCSEWCVTLRGGAFQRYREDADRLVGFGAARLGWRRASYFVTIEGEGGFMPRAYGQLSVAFGLRTLGW